MRGPYSFDFTNLAALNAGVAVYTPTVGDILLDAWFEITTLFNAATNADVSQYSSASVNGLFGFVDFPVTLSASADSVAKGGGPLQNDAGSTASLIKHGGATIRLAPGRFTTADPLLLVANATGNRNAGASAATAGAARLYIVTATPAAFS